MIVTVVPIMRLRRATVGWSYQVAPNQQCRPGSLVMIPFRGRPTLGIVWEEEKTSNHKLETILEIITPQPLIKTHHRRFIEWLSESGLISLSSSLYSWLPKSLRSLPLSNTNKALLNEATQNIPTASELTLLTQQLVALPNQREESAVALRKKYGEQVAELFGTHSAQEELRQWVNILTGKVRVILGRERAIYAPFLNLRHILIQEPEDIGWYREQLPYISMVEAVSELATIWSAQLTSRSYVPKEAATLLWPELATLSNPQQATITTIDLRHNDLLSDTLLSHLQNLPPDKKALILYNAHDRLVQDTDNRQNLLPGIETLRKKLARLLGYTELPATIILDTRHMFSHVHQQVGYTAVLSLDPLLAATNFADTVHGWGDLGHLLSYNAPCTIQTHRLDHPLVISLNNHYFATYCADQILTRERHHLPPFTTTIVCSLPTDEMLNPLEDLRSFLTPLLESTNWQLTHPFSTQYRKHHYQAIMLYNPQAERLPRAVITKLSQLTRPWKVQRNPWFVL